MRPPRAPRLPRRPPTPTRSDGQRLKQAREEGQIARSRDLVHLAASSALLAWLTVAAVAIALLTLTGAASVAAALHRAYSLGWVSATVAAGLLLALPLALETRTIIGLLCGPMVGIAVHLVALGRGERV